MQLSLQKFLVEGDYNRVVAAEDLLLGAIHLHPFQARRGEPAELAAGHGQQVGMLGGDQGADKMKGGPCQSLKGLRTIVALVKNQRDVVAGLSQIAIVGAMSWVMERNSTLS